MECLENLLDIAIKMSWIYLLAFAGTAGVIAAYKILM